MKKIVLRTTIFFLPILIFLSIWFMQYGFPPPRFSTSLSFDAAIQNIKEKQLDDSIKVLAIGSSLTLNNLHTETIKKNLNEKYLNISSWGQNIEEDYNLLKVLVKYFKPTKIIISSGYLDFIKSSKKINYLLIDNYLQGKRIIAYKETSANYLIKKSKTFFDMRLDTNNYASLRYDDCGGVSLEGNGFNIDPVRWQGNNIKKFDIDYNQYLYLDSIAHFCKIKGMKLIFVNNPYRKGYYSKLDDPALGILDAHAHMIDSLLKRNNQVFIDAHNETWDDSLFVDYSHLNKKGAKKYTEYFIKESFNYNRNSKGGYDGI